MVRSYWGLLTTLYIYSINFHWHPLVNTFKVALAELRSLANSVICPASKVTLLADSMSPLYDMEWDTWNIPEGNGDERLIEVIEFTHSPIS